MLGRVIHTDEALVVGSSVFKAVMAVVQMKRYSSSAIHSFIHLLYSMNPSLGTNTTGCGTCQNSINSIDHIPTEVIQLGGGTVQSKAHKLSISIVLYLQPTLMHNSITTCMSHYYPRHVLGLDVLILLRMGTSRPETCRG